MQDLQPPYKPVPSEEDFISYLQWFVNKSFYLNFGGGDTSGTGARNQQAKATNWEENEEVDNEG